MTPNYLNQAEPSILIIDDEPDNVDVIETLLSCEADSPECNSVYQLHYAMSGPEAIAALDIFQPDLILLDVMMPGMNGMEVCQHIKAQPQWEGVPIIMVTALTSKVDLAACLAAGADDFISKPVNRLELIARVRSMLRIRHQYRQLTAFNTQLEDLVQQRTAQLQTLLDQDTLTQLPSRTYLLQQLAVMLSESEHPIAVVYLDCDQFKLVNSSLGHAVGNQLLIAIAQRLQQQLRPQDLLARPGEDEFCFLLPDLTNEAALEAWICGIQRCFEQPFAVASCEIFMTVCVGISRSDSQQQHPEKLLQEADTAMYQAKLKGKGSYQIFDQQIHAAVVKRLNLENDLQRALDRQEFIDYYQPIVHLPTQQLAGFEALVRWQHPERGLVAPGEFIPSMETTGLIVPVGLVVLKQACQKLRDWHDHGWTTLTMSVNLSVRQFTCLTLLADIDRVLAETAVNPACLKLEITESAIMDKVEGAIALLEQLRSRQIQISVDDFGTGYSSLGYLHRFPIDILKIDRSFVNQLQATQHNNPVVDTIITLSRHLNLAVTAEGIETQAQMTQLQALGCDFGQGYYFSPPLPAAEVERRYLSSAGAEIKLPRL